MGFWYVLSVLFWLYKYTLNVKCYNEFLNFNSTCYCKLYYLLFCDYLWFPPPPNNFFLDDKNDNNGKKKKKKPLKKYLGPFR